MAFFCTIQMISEALSYIGRVHTVAFPCAGIVTEFFLAWPVVSDSITAVKAGETVQWLS